MSLIGIGISWNILEYSFVFKTGVWCQMYSVGFRRFVSDTAFYEVHVSTADVQYMAKSQLSGPRRRALPIQVGSNLVRGLLLLLDKYRTSGQTNNTQ